MWTPRPTHASKRYDCLLPTLACRCRGAKSSMITFVMLTGRSSVCQFFYFLLLVRRGYSFGQVIRDELSNATVLTVAHRLGTIIFYDRVMVLKEGAILEYDT